MQQQLAERYYETVWRHYMFQVSCITREDYGRMQAAIPGYAGESYDEHMSRLVQGIPNDVSIMIGHICTFLETHVEFQSPRYLNKIEEMGAMMRSDVEKFKMQAFEILLKQSATQNNETQPRVEAHPPRMEAHPPLFEVSVGPAHFVLPTYCNPLMTCFYSLIFVCFAGFQRETVDDLEEEY